MSESWIEKQLREIPWYIRAWVRAVDGLDYLVDWVLDRPYWNFPDGGGSELRTLRTNKKVDGDDEDNR